MTTLSRLRRMSLAEITYRSRQEAAKWIDRMTPAVPGGDLRSPVSRRQTRLADGDAAVRQFVRSRASSLIGPELPERIRELWPDYAQATVAAAERTCSNRFSLLGYEALSFGSPIDWHLDPVAGRRAPFIHWSLIDPLDASATGDSKVIWELNRHQWLVTIAQAYRFTGDERYADRVSQMLEEWLDANPRGIGINWASSLELALRAIAWTWTLALLRPSRALQHAVFARVGVALRDHAGHIERYLSRYFSPNTHLTGEALGLFYIGVHFDGFQAAARWRALGLRILVEQLERQTLEDGVYFEQATCYQRYTIEFYLHLLILCARHGIRLPDVVERRVIRMCEFLRAVCDDDGSMPAIGDGDGGWLLPLVQRKDDDCRGVLSVAATVLRRPDLACDSPNDRAPETAWLVGHDAGQACQATRRSRSSSLFPAGGYAIMRSGQGPDSLQLIFDVGPLGCSVSGAHGHADLLSVQCSAFGRALVTDAGTYCYTTEPAWRNYFRGSAAHSTVLIDDVGQAEPAGPFSWRSRPACKLRNWQSTPEFDYADAEHAGYERLADPVRHRRRVLFVKPRYWIVFDELIGAARHDVRVRFHTGASPIQHGQAFWVGSGAPGLWIVPIAVVPLACSVVEGAEAPMNGWRSDAYGRRKPASVLSCGGNVQLPFQMATLLMPRSGGQADVPRVSPVRGRNGDVVGVILPDEGQVIRFTADGFTLEVL